MFFKRKNIVVSELDDALKAFATTFGIEMNLFLLHKVGFVSMLMVKAMQARLRCIDEATRQLMVFGAVMELDIPSNRDEQHDNSHQKGADLQQPFFHAAKIQNYLFLPPD